MPCGYSLLRLVIPDSVEDLASSDSAAAGETPMSVAKFYSYRAGKRQAIDLIKTARYLRVSNAFSKINNRRKNYDKHAKCDFCHCALRA